VVAGSVDRWSEGARSSDGHREVVERGSKSVPVGDVGGDVVVTAVKVLDESVTGSDGAG
jgi:hypothetical protein